MPHKHDKKSNQKKTSTKNTSSDLKKQPTRKWEDDNKADRDYDESIESPRTKNRRS